MPTDAPTPWKPVSLAEKKQDKTKMCDKERTTILASLPSTLICDQCGKEKDQGKFSVNQLRRYRDKARCWDCTGTPVADPRFAGSHDYSEKPDTSMPPRRLLIDDPEGKTALAPIQLVFDDSALKCQPHPVEAMEKIRLAQLQDANLVPLIRYLRDGSIPYRVKPARWRAKTDEFSFQAVFSIVRSNTEINSTSQLWSHFSCSAIFSACSTIMRSVLTLAAPRR
jgi:hypothetical protein